MKDGATLPLLLKELRLPSMGQLWKEISEQARSKGWSPERYLVTLCEHELADRQRRMQSRRFQESKLPRGKTLEGFDFEAVPGLNKMQIALLGKGDLWIKDNMNILIFGPSGVGKTHIAVAIGAELVANGYRVFFTRTTELLQRLQAAKQSLTLPSALEKLDKYDCLILDDFGYVKKNESETTLLFELISDRYERKSLMITCNQPFQEWGNIFEDTRMAVAAVDRLVHRANILDLQAQSYRRKEALQRQGKI